VDAVTDIQQEYGPIVWLRGIAEYFSTGACFLNFFNKP
jgi:hypothetical protein